ncbi:MAG: hypothetical protein WC260_00215 [Candidatus Pacearchaeota archaeon]
MKNKKGQLFSLYLVLITLFFLGLVFLGYIQNQKNINASLISPIKVLLIEDKQRIFEYNEEKLIKELFCEDSPNERFNKINFCEKLEPYSEYLKEDLYVDNQRIVESSWQNKESWINFCEELYVIKIENENLIISRKNLNKKIILEPLDSEKSQFEKVKFKTILDYTYNKEYNINC